MIPNPASRVDFRKTLRGSNFDQEKSMFDVRRFLPHFTVSYTVNMSTKQNSFFTSIHQMRKNCSVKKITDTDSDGLSFLWAWGSLIKIIRGLFFILFVVLKSNHN